jgi:type II secretory pathway component PulF
MNLKGLFFNRRMRAEVWLMLADLTGTGMELGRALDLVGKTFEKRGPGIKSILEELRKSLASDRFKEVVRKYTPESESLIFAKFGHGSDADLFRAAGRIAEVEAEIHSAIMSAIFRPVFILIMMTVLLFFLGKDFYPTLMLVSPMEEWPGTWQTVASAALYVADNPFMIFIYLGIAYGVYKVVQLNYVGPFRTRLDRIPPFSLYRLKVGATFTFVVLENAAVGNSINSNLMRTLSKDSSRYAKSRIMAIEKNISSMNIGAAAIEAGMDFPDPELNAVLEAYAEQKNWVSSFRAYAESWLRRLEAKVKTAVSALNIVLMMITAAFIAVVGQTIFGIVNVIN